MKFFSKTSLRWAKIGISLVFVGWLLHRVEWRGVWERVRHLDTSFVWAYLFFIMAGFAISAQKWSFIAKTQGICLSVGESFHAYLTGAFLNNFFPSTIGGDTYRALWLGKKFGSKSVAAVTVIFDRLSGLIATVLLTLIFSLWQWDLILRSSVWLSALAFLVVGLVMMGVVWWGGKRILRLVRGFIHIQEVIQPLTQLLGKFSAISFSKRSLFDTIVYAMLFNFIGVGMANFFLFQAVGITVPILSFFSVIFLISIIASLPISINNIGVKEWAYYTFFGLLGINAEAAIAVALIGRFLQMLISFAAFPSALRWVSKKE